MRCYGINSTDCCLFYNDGMCVSNCTSPLIPDNNFNCICPGFFIYPTCTGTCVLHCECICNGSYIFNMWVCSFYIHPCEHSYNITSMYQICMRAYVWACNNMCNSA